MAALQALYMKSPSIIAVNFVSGLWLQTQKKFRKTDVVGLSLTDDVGLELL